MGGLQSCADLCIGKQNKVDKDNPYYFEAFKKIPSFGSISNYLKMIKPNQGQSQFPSIGNLIGLVSKDNPLQPQGLVPPSGPHGPTPPPGPPSSFNLSALTNLIAVGTTNASGASLFNLIGDDSFVKKIKKSNYSQIVKSLQEKGQKYTDSDFPPNQKSLGDLSKKGIDMTKVTWKRVGQIIKDPLFISQKIQPSDILQGELGDCYFLSALASLAEQDYRIKNVFISLEVSSVGIYMARILHNGEYQQVVIDDYFPVNDKGRVLFAKPAGNREIWVMVLQKCWAKLYGSYTSIVGGLPNQVLHAFSSAPVFFRSIPSVPEKQQALWAELLESQRNGALICCGSKSDASIEALGFVKGHAYTILGVYDQPFKLIKLRNPWGSKEWKGRASDYDLDFWNQVSPTDKQKLDYEDSKRNKDKDGVFFIIWDDFVKYFQLVDICRINDNAHYNFLPTEFQHLTPKLFQFEVRGEEALVTFAVTQSNNRGTSQTSYSRTFLALGKWDESTKSYKYIKSNSDKKFPDNYLQIKKCTPGKYVLYAKYFWSGGASKATAVVSVYSTSPATVVEGVQTSSEQFLNHIFYDHANSNSKKKVINATGDWICSDILLNEGGFSYFVSSLNQQSTAKLGITIQQSEYTEKRLVLQSPFKGSQTSKQEVGPGNRLVVVAELQAETFPTSITNPVPTVVHLQ